MIDEAFRQRLLAPEATDQWLWMVIVGACGSLFAAFGIGANDVANAFATSVGARAVTLKQAIVLAGIFEFLGAVLMGDHVTKTIREGIADVGCFVDNPGILMYGMMCVVYTTGAWLLLASYLELPVSTTHSTIGGMIGMAITFGGHKCVIWYEECDTFPYVRGVFMIVASWFLAPVCAGIVSLLVFLAIRTIVLRSPDAFQRSLWAFPVLVMVPMTVSAFMVVYRRRVHNANVHMTTCSVAFGWALGMGFVVALALVFVFLPVITRNVALLYNEDGTRKPVSYNPRVIPIRTSPMPGETARQNTEQNTGDAGSCKTDDPSWSKAGGIGLGVPGELEAGRLGSFLGKKLGFEGSSLDMHVDRDLRRHVTREVHFAAESPDEVAEIHANAAEVFDARAEEIFKYVQVAAAICDAFAHGANDVANAMGPFEIMLAVYIRGRIPTHKALGSSEYIILALGGLGIVLGLMLSGYKIIKAIGVKITNITPARGFSIELGAAIAIITGTRLGMPLSTTHSQVGATAGVALLEGARGLNICRVAVKMIMGCVTTMLICGLSCALIFAQGVYAPHAYDTV